jgi:phage tail-like protein
MARAKSTDFLHNFRFHVIVTGFGGGNQPQLGSSSADGTVSAGFNTCSTPEATQEAVEYREGHFIYTKKYSGMPTISDISLSRGVAKSDGTFWTWMKSVIEGNEEYRANLRILHFHRDSKPVTSSTPGAPNEVQKALEAGSIEYKCGEAFPTRHKVSSDLDATGSEVSIQELDLAIEWFDVIDHAAPP